MCLAEDSFGICGASSPSSPPHQAEASRVPGGKPGEVGMKEEDALSKENSTQRGEEIGPPHHREVRFWQGLQ